MSPNGQGFDNFCIQNSRVTGAGRTHFDFCQTDVPSPSVKFCRERSLHSLLLPAMSIVLLGMHLGNLGDDIFLH